MRIIVEKDKAFDDFPSENAANDWVESRIGHMDIGTVLLLSRHRRTMGLPEAEVFVYMRDQIRYVLRRITGCASCKFRASDGWDSRCLKGHQIMAGAVCSKYDPLYRKTRFKRNPELDREIAF